MLFMSVPVSLPSQYQIVLRVLEIMLFMLVPVSLPSQYHTVLRVLEDGRSGDALASLPLLYLIVLKVLESIGSLAFRNCNALTSITIPKSIKYIGEGAFDCSNLSVVVSQIEDPFVTEIKNTWFFSQNTYYNATLYVPVGTIDKYRAADGWKDFLYIEEGTGPEGTTPEIPKCANPTISYLNGVLTFDCKTEGATCEYSITDNDIKAGSGNEVQLTTTYDISVYAAKTGYKNSDIVTATLCWIETEPKTEDITSGVANVSALPVLIQAQDGIITVKGINDGALVSAYDINGKHEGVGVGNHGVANIETSLKTGNVAIVSIGMKSIKVVMR